MSCPLPAHPRQMDFSFMLLSPLPPAIFPSLPLRHLPTPPILAVTFPIRYQPPSSAVCLFHIFVIITVKYPHQFLLMGGWALSHSLPVVFLLFAHLPCLPLHFLPHQNGTPLSIDSCFFNCGLLASSSWCLPPGGILDGMGALSLSFPLAIFPPYPSLLRLPPHLLARPSLRGRVPRLIRVHYHLAEGDVVSP
jgi:hypothetical protein